eukprot:m.198834 g.198834  ORF g.198834 m.198834 type:complete len:673 (-) comp18763_c0_seq1:245-2263(-)
MDTRSARLRRAARTAVAKALNDEKENPVSAPMRTTRSRTTIAASRSRTRGLQNGNVNKPISSQEVSRRSTKSKVRAPPNWALIHKQEEERKAKRMSANKKPVTTADNVKLHSQTRAMRTRNVGKASAASDDETKIPKPNTTVIDRKNTHNSSTTDSTGGFESDSSALDSILSNAGIQTQGSLNVKKRMSCYHANPSSSTHVHKKGVQNATKAIQELHLKRQSMYSRSSPTDDVPAREHPSTNALTQTATAASRDELRANPSTIGFAMRTDAAARRHTLAPNTRPGRPQNETHAEHTDGFVEDRAALENILVQEKIEVADKSKRASIHFGAMRVLNKTKQQKKTQVLQSDATEGEYPPFTPSGNNSHLYRNTTSTITPRRYTLSHHRNLNTHAPSLAIAPTTPSQRPHRTLPVPNSAHRTTANMLHANSAANLNITRTAPRPRQGMTAAERGVKMQTPRTHGMRPPPATVGGAVGSRRFCDVGDDVAVPSMGRLLDGPSEDAAEQQLNADEEQTKQALLEIRQMELELEQELARELALEANPVETASDIQPSTIDTTTDSVSHGAWNDIPTTKPIQPASHSIVGNDVQALITPLVECTDEISAELINIGVFGTKRPGQRVIANPLLSTMREPQAYQFLSIATSPVVPAARSVGPVIKPTATSAFRPSRRLSLV